jgi:SPP1 gp7 family putative phage head morphogenesis protein
MADTPKLFFGTDVAPKAALKFFRGKGLKTSFSWQDVWKEEHDAAFTVAKMADVDLLSDVRNAVDAAIANGETLQEFSKKLKPTLVERGWWGQAMMVDPLTQEEKEVQLGSARRLDTIFRTNMQTAYAAADLDRYDETKDDAPYLMYDAVDDKRTRPLHHAWDSTVLRGDDPWWQSHRPPNGFNCRCSTVQLSDADLRAMGKSVDTAPPVVERQYVNKRTGEIEKIPVGIDPGFNYNPGASRSSMLKQRLDDKVAAFKAGK